MIQVSGIQKTFRVAKRKEGPFGAVRSLFRREYREIRAVQDLTFSVKEGELVGFIGPNGAGKSTTVKILSGILIPDGGECRVMDYVPWRQREAYVRHIGVVFGQRTQLWWDVPVRDSLELLRDIYRLTPSDYAESLARSARALDIQALLDTPLRQLSLGQRMRCELAASLLHRPRLLFLDEPTIGLDAVSKQALRAFIRQINKDEGVTVLLTTHDTADLEALTRRILLLGKGSLLYDGTLEGLRSRYDHTRTLNLRFSGNPPAVALPMGELLRWNEGTASYRVPSEAIPGAIASLAQTLSLTDVTVEEKPVDEVIADLYRTYAI